MNAQDNLCTNMYVGQETGYGFMLKDVCYVYIDYGL